MVFIELTKELSGIQKAKEEKEKEYQGLMETIDTLEPRSREKREAWARYFQIKKDLNKLEQNILYHELRIHTRLVQDRKEYMEARRNKTEWPNPQSYEDYKLQRKLASAPKTWRRGHPEKKEEKKEQKKAGGKQSAPSEEH